MVISLVTVLAFFVGFIAIHHSFLGFAFRDSQNPELHNK